MALPAKLAPAVLFVRVILTVYFMATQAGA
jgi:hypothetical protein